ncbi:FecR family protein [Maribacter sp. ACAM166]|uniref:FecR family protein n=1 Tax=Maribacter sp. ACAM166 TaxID=2508996 RepID=UPI001485414E|nr:FecR family protein [Maribacter sp. ACAM166]
MMKESKAQKLIVKFLNKEINHEELDQLYSWIKNNKNSNTFNEYVRTEYLTNAFMKNYNVENAKKVIAKKVERQKRKKRIQLFKKLAVAASVLILFGIITFNIQSNNIETEVVDYKIQIESGSNKAILTLDNGNEITLEKGKKYATDKLTSNGEKLVYKNTEKASKLNTKTYNYLTVPRGGQFFIQLSDRTKVWLNSDSKLKFPTVFSKDETRKIELVYGEAYLEVSPSSDNNDTSFSLICDGQEISVIGTHFNIRAYSDDHEIATTLIEGKVLVKKDGFEEILNPNQQSIINNESNGIKVIAVDGSQEISWVKGVFTFNEKSLVEIMKILSRWYDVEVIFESAELKNYVFTGVLERTDSFLGIIKLIEATSENEVTFEVNNKTITIK